MQAPFVDKETFITLTTISCTNVILSTHDGTYRQIDYLLIGLPPVTLSNIWLSKYEPPIQNDAKLFEYMDDIIRTIKESLIENELYDNNLLHPNWKLH